MVRGIWRDEERFVKAYFSDVKKDGKPVYFTGDGAMYDDDGYITITGRTDDVINVSGHRLGTAEIEAAIQKYDNVAEVAVVGKPDKIKGESVFAYIVLKSDSGVADELEEFKTINAIIKQEIGSIATCENIVFVPGLPKTRSGKIMRRILRSLAKSEAITQDISTLEDPSIVATISELIGQ